MLGKYSAPVLNSSPKCSFHVAQSSRLAHQITWADAGLTLESSALSLSTSKDVAVEQDRNSERQEGSEALSVKQVMFVLILSSWRSRISTLPGAGEVLSVGKQMKKQFLLSPDGDVCFSLHKWAQYLASNCPHFGGNPSSSPTTSHSLYHDLPGLCSVCCKRYHWHGIEALTSWWSRLPLSPFTLPCGWWVSVKCAGQLVQLYRK